MFPRARVFLRESSCGLCAPHVLELPVPTLNRASSSWRVPVATFLARPVEIVLLLQPVCLLPLQHEGMDSLRFCTASLSLVRLRFNRKARTPPHWVVFEPVVSSSQSSPTLESSHAGTVCVIGRGATDFQPSISLEPRSSSCSGAETPSRSLLDPIRGLFDA